MCLKALYRPSLLRFKKNNEAESVSEERLTEINVPIRNTL